jgi:Dyp-type peroxidase family
VTAPASPTLELADIQGGVLRGYGYGFATYLTIRTTAGDAARAWLGALAGDVTSAEPWSAGKPELALNVALTATGLDALGVPTAGFPDEFRAGMASRARRLGDTGDAAPEHWEPGLRGVGEGHVLVIVNARREGDDDARCRALVADLAERGAGEVIHRQDTAVLPFGREHFGFSDGFAQPSVAGSGQPNRPGEGVPQSFARWRLLRPGEIVLGYEDEDGLLPPAPPAPLHRNATFMVVRKLHQDVAAWRTWLRAAADEWAGGDEEWLAAKIVGRWTDGTPTARQPSRSPHTPISSLEEINAFRYGRDPGGMRCPVGAHVRRVNPREGLSGGSARTRRHRIIRRGMPYGPPLPGSADDGAERGLHFACFQSSIARQFEVVQDWSVDGNVFALGRGNRDFLAGGATQPFVLPGSPPVRLPAPERPFVTVRGGEYLFVPSLRGLRAIAAGEVPS